MRRRIRVTPLLQGDLFSSLPPPTEQGQTDNAWPRLKSPAPQVPPADGAEREWTPEAVEQLVASTEHQLRNTQARRTRKKKLQVGAHVGTIEGGAFRAFIRVEERGQEVRWAVPSGQPPEGFKEWGEALDFIMVHFCDLDALREEASGTALCRIPAESLPGMVMTEVDLPEVAAPNLRQCARCMRGEHPRCSVEVKRRWRDTPVLKCRCSCRVPAGAPRLLLKDEGFAQGPADSTCYVCGTASVQTKKSGLTEDPIGKAHNTCLNALPEPLAKKRAKLVETL